MLIAEHRQRETPHRDTAPELHFSRYPRSFRFARQDEGGIWCGVGSGKGRARLCPGTVRDGLFAVSGLGSNQDGLPGTVLRCVQTGPHRDRVVVVRLSRFLPGTRSLLSLCPCSGLDGIPAVPLSWYWSRTGSSISLCSGTGRDELCPCPHHPRITPVLHPSIFPAASPNLSVAASGGDYAGCPESPAFDSIPPAGLSQGPPNPRVKRIAGVYMQSRAVGSIPGMPQRPAASLPGGFVAAGSRTTLRECSSKSDPKVRAFRCHSSPTHLKEETTGHPKHYFPRGETEAWGQAGITGILLRSPKMIWGSPCNGFPPDPKPAGGRGGTFPGPAA